MGRLHLGVFIFCGFSLLTSCRMIGFTRTVMFRPPDAGDTVLPAESLAGWELRWYDGTEVRSRLLAGGPVEVEIIRELPIIAAVRPLAAGAPSFWNFRSAGFLLAAHEVPPAECAFTPEDGFAAAFLLDLAESGIPPQSISIPRFRDAVERRAGGRPWNLDTRRLKEDLAAGELWLYSFVLLEEHEVEISLPEGLWYRAEAERAPLDAGPAGIALSLPEGTSSFLRLSDGLAAEVHVNGRGDVQVMLR